MAVNCNQLRSALARQTPVFDSTFLEDFVSEMVNEPYVGRHQTEVWEDGASQIFFDKIHVQQPNFLTAWQRRGSGNGSDCAANVCNPPRTLIGNGSTRDSYFTEQLVLQSQPWCLDELRQIPHIGKQMAQILKINRQMPLSFVGDYIRTHTASYHDSIQIAGSSFNTFAPTSGNTDSQLATINLGSTAALPTSELTWPILQYYGQLLGMRGYNKDSGLASGMRNLITHSRTWFKLVGDNPEIKSQLHLVGVKDLSPLYKIGEGVNADPFGNYAVTFDEHQVRFQHLGNGLLQRVLPYLNSPATTGEKPIVNTAWFNARYALSTINHPKAYTVLTSKPKKIHDLIPSVNSAMWGQWTFINNPGIIQWTNTDGTTCQQNNDLQWWFYWLCYLETGFKYEQRDLEMPILHLIDGAGKACVIDQPICGTAPQYVIQSYNVGLIECTS